MEQTESTQDVVRVNIRHDLGSPKSLVCEKCWSEVFDTDLYETVCMTDDYAFEHTSSQQDIQIAALAGCNWCRFILSKLRNRDAPTTQVKVKFSGTRDPFSRVVTPRGQNTYCLSISTKGDYSVYHLFAYAHASDAAAKFVTARKLQPNVSSDLAIEQCGEWLSDCASSHKQCRKPSACRLPTRVVDVSPGGSSNDPRLLETSGMKGEYLTLSYCWGKEQSGVLTSQNIAAYCERLDMAAISRTAKDAIDLTKRLGFRFIWIDALCIMQNSEQDWENELSNMHGIYRNSLLTIVASCASDAREGFLADRSSDDLEGLFNRQLVNQGISLDPSDQSSPISTYEVPFRYHNGCMGRMFIRTDYYKGDILEPVNRRAWTFQEQLLTPRMLLFSSHTLQWRCQSHSRNLDDSLHVQLYHYGFIQPLSTEKYESPWKTDDDGDGKTEQKGESKIWTDWNDIVYQYSARQTSLPGDKLVALGGIAEEFSTFRMGRYLAGLWENRLCEQLMWVCPQGPRPSRPAQYRAPSWSWAAIDGPILMGELSVGRKVRQRSCIAEVVECDVELKSQILPFGAVKGGFVKLKAARRPGRLCFFEKDPRSNAEKPPSPFVIWEDNDMWKTDEHNFTRENSNAFRGATATLDVLGLTSKKAVECFVIRDNSHDEFEGLLLQRSDDGLYRRIGLFDHAKKAAFENIEAEEVVVI